MILPRSFPICINPDIRLELRQHNALIDVHDSSNEMEFSRRNSFTSIAWPTNGGLGLIVVDFDDGEIELNEKNTFWTDGMIWNKWLLERNIELANILLLLSHEWLRQLQRSLENWSMFESFSSVQLWRKKIFIFRDINTSFFHQSLFAENEWIEGAPTLLMGVYQTKTLPASLFYLMEIGIFVFSDDEWKKFDAFPNADDLWIHLLGDQTFTGQKDPLRWDKMCFHFNELSIMIGTCTSMPSSETIKGKV